MRPAALSLCLALAAAPAWAGELQEANKKLVLDMWRGVIEEASEVAVMRYIAPGYIQHNTRLPDGRNGLLEGVRRLKNPPPGEPPHRKKTLVKAVAEDDLVVLIWIREEPDAADPKKMVKVNRFDMFRVKDGLVQEHWDDSAPIR
jgi:predicted SnoaL-like aldol condensation-catalyzing enzyme